MCKEKTFLVSACLLGLPCRYDGKDQKNTSVIALKKRHRLLAFCPELAGGLGVPRPPAELVQGCATLQTGESVHAQYEKGAALGLKLAQRAKIDGAILKSKSPACGYGLIYDGSFRGQLTKGNGVFAQKLLQAGFPVFNEHTFSKEI